MTTQISASLVKQLRDLTGAGMMDCKRALQEADGDIEEARRLLRERGMAQAGKRAGRETTEGLVAIQITDKVGAIVGVGCETEPVSKNEEFRAFVDKLLGSVLTTGPEGAEGVEDERLELIGKLGENIVVVGAAQYVERDGEALGGYVHPPANKIGVLVELQGGTPELARQLAMHISFASPEWMTRGDVPTDAVAAEREIYLNSDEVQSKPEGAREKIVDGMLTKRFFAASPGGVLVDQTWIHDASRTVGQALEEAGAEVVAFERISVGAS